MKAARLNRLFNPTDNVADYHRDIEKAGGLPVQVRRESKEPELEISVRTPGLIEQEACGIVYGRIIIQHPRPAAMTRAFMATLQQGATPGQAALALPA